MKTTTRLPTLALLAGLAAPLAGCGAASPLPEDGGADADTPTFAAASAAIDSVYGAFTEAYAEASVAKLMSEVYARDAFYLPPGEDILVGQTAFRGQFQGFLEPIAAQGGPGPQISFEILDRDISGDLAYDIGYYVLRPPGAGPEFEGSRGKFIVIWKRNAEGQWRIHADGFSAVDR